ncbi:single-stranded DNA-binding protein [Thermospira aquatica]|uniref:Single-stranded DNA-binding protein n=1 Tax=Thermospira aquatica TaxID=2828656 RepID=A0AAX3BEM0_9SPIR|nr:single-stranded DNA-binding protein [Thermospira aquatica]URA10563.1 single-stranded DNA-binding protein [Thermospira aquatica]
MSKSVNVVVVEGGVVREPQIRYTSEGSAYTRFAIAHTTFSQKEPDQKQTCYFEVAAWGKIAEVCAAYLKKGRRIIVSGKLHQSRWEDPTGQKHAKVTITANDVKFMPPSKQKKNS